ncbi:MAG TPA: SPFH domain-containing protein, partial [Flexilinea sp.]|nr:SPFH domain-containing protein [Flexilinea sp.]
MENYQPEKRKPANKPFGISKTLWITIAVILLLVLFFITFKPVYIMVGLGQQEMGVKIRAGEIIDIVGPGGIYSDFGLYVKMERYNIEGVQFQVSDDEVFTKDMQPVYVEIRGQVFRPALNSVKIIGSDGTVQYFSKDEITKNFVNYRQIYTDNAALETQMDGFSRQAMKVCVGQNDLRGNAVAEGRDILRNCIEAELEKLTRDIGLYVNNIVVTDVKASEQAMVVINETNQYLL